MLFRSEMNYSRIISEADMVMKNASGVISLSGRVPGRASAAMQYIQLMLTGSARGWLNTQPKNAFRTWDEFEEAFVKSFLGTYSRPTTYVELQACKQGRDEPLRSYIQRWTLLRNTMETASEDRVMDAFMHGVSRRGIFQKVAKTLPLPRNY